MSLSTNVSDLATAVGTKVKETRTWINGNMSDLSGLTTTDKSNLVAAINEVLASVGSAAGIDDGTIGTSSTWSSRKIRDEIDVVADDLAAFTEIDDAHTATSSTWSSTKIQDVVDAHTEIDDSTASTSSTYSSTKIGVDIAAAVAALVDGSPGALDTLKELADALGDDANFAATTSTSLGNRVRVDTAAQGLNSTEQGNARTNIAAADAVGLASLVTAVGSTTTNYVTAFEAALA